jgi:hypothetical protein
VSHNIGGGRWYIWVVGQYYYMDLYGIILLMQVQELTDPRQLKCLALYRNPNSDTFSNLKASALKAGYSVDYADTLSVVNPLWLSASVKSDVDRVVKAEQYIDEVMNIQINVKSKIGVDVARLKLDVTRLILKTLARQKYSEEKEQFEPNVQINVVNYNKIDPQQKPIKEVESL